MTYLWIGILEDNDNIEQHLYFAVDIWKDLYEKTELETFKKKAVIASDLLKKMEN